MKKIGVAVVGFGTVGAGVAKILLENHAVLSARTGVEIALARVADLDITTDRGVAVEPSVLTTDAFAAIADPAVDVVVELIGGTGIAKKVILAAIDAGKAVVTANKKLLAECGAEIFGRAAEKGVDIYFGAAVGGGIPIIRVLREGLVGNRIQNIHGILNGTCNYILTRMEDEGLPFDEVLADAQRLGYAEANPSLDIDGFDTAHKALILAALSYGVQLPLSSILVEGIRGLDGRDVRYAAELGYKIKLMATVACDEGALGVYVAPTLVPKSHMLASVSGVFNAAMVKSDMADETLYYGRGAGRLPTASTVVGDIADVAMNIAAGEVRHRRVIADIGEKPRQMQPDEMRNAFYIRLLVEDRAGSLGRISSALGDRGVSIAAAMQKGGEGAPGAVPVVVVTHAAREADVRAALDSIRASGVVSEAPVSYRILKG